MKQKHTALGLAVSSINFGTARAQRRCRPGSNALKRLGVSIVALTALPFLAQAAWTYDFKTSGIDTNYWSTNNPNGTFTFTPSESGVTVAGGNGSFQTAKLSLNLAQFPSLTDFTISVTFTGAQLSGGVHQVQLETSWPGGGVLLDRSNQASVGTPGGNSVNVYDGAVLALTAVGAAEGTSTPATLTLTRSGTTFTGYWNGSQFWTGNYSTNPLSTVTLAINNNYGASDATAVTWQSFSITPSPMPISFTAVSMVTNGQFRLCVTGTTGFTYTVHMTTNLLTTNTVWTTLSTNTATNGTFDFVDTNATNRTRFYRAMKQ